MGVVPGLDLRIIDLGSRRIALRWQQREADFALLILQRIDAVELRRGQKIR
jgi:hypothetical protein